MKSCFILPIFKERDNNSVFNYKPVNIMCAVSKIFERLVFNKLLNQVKAEIHYSQHGFFANRSTQTDHICCSPGQRRKRIQAKNYGIMLSISNYMDLLLKTSKETKTEFIATIATYYTSTKIYISTSNR